MYVIKYKANKGVVVVVVLGNPILKKSPKCRFREKLATPKNLRSLSEKLGFALDRCHRRQFKTIIA